MRVSSIDVGSNAIRLVIMEIHKNGQWEQIKKFRAPLRLGTDVFNHKELQPETIIELIEVFKKIAKLNKKNKVDKVLAVATSAMRDARNRKTVTRLIKKTSGIDIKVITGADEAKLIRHAIHKSNSNHIKKSLLVDIGGGSAEITGLDETTVLFSKSYPLGVVRLMTLQNKVSIYDHCLKYLSRIKKEAGRHHFTVAVGTGGNFDAIARLKLSLLKKAPQTHMSIEEFHEIKKIWKNLSLDQKKQLGLRPDRIDVLDYAMTLIELILDIFQINKIKIPMTGLKEGSIQTLL